MSAARDLRALYTRHHRLVRWIVRASGVPERSVDDVIQDVFVAIHRRRAQAPDGDLRRWIVGVTRSVSHSHRRAAARRHDRLAQLGEPEAAPSLERWIEGKRALARLDAVLAAIDPGQREAWILVELEGSSAPEAAEALGANVNTIYSRVRLARRKIEAAFADADATAERLRTVGEPGPERTRGVWAGIVGQLSPTATSVPVVAGGTATGAVGWLGGLTIGAAIGAGVLGTIAWARSPRPAPADSTAVAGSTAPGEPARATTPWALAFETDRTQEQTVRETASPGDVDSASQKPLRDPPRARPLAPDAAVRSPAPESTSMLAAESRLLREAARAIDRGALDDAAALLDRHARDHEGGTLRPERERLRDRLRDLREGEAAP